MGRETKAAIKTGKYTPPTPDGWAGWIEDKGSTWILFYREDGSATFYAAREASGAVIGEGLASGKG